MPTVLVGLFGRWPVDELKSICFVEGATCGGEREVTVRKKGPDRTLVPFNISRQLRRRTAREGHTGILKIGSAGRLMVEAGVFNAEMVSPACTTAFDLLLCLSRLEAALLQIAPIIISREYVDDVPLGESPQAFLNRWWDTAGENGRRYAAILEALCQECDEDPRMGLVQQLFSLGSHFNFGWKHIKPYTNRGACLLHCMTQLQRIMYELYYLLFEIEKTERFGTVFNFASEKRSPYTYFYPRNLEELVALVESLPKLIRMVGQNGYEPALDEFHAEGDAIKEAWWLGRPKDGYFELVRIIQALEGVHQFVTVALDINQALIWALPIITEEAVAADPDAVIQEVFATWHRESGGLIPAEPMDKAMWNLSCTNWADYAGLKVPAWSSGEVEARAAEAA